MRIGPFITCLADAMFPEVGRATIAVLERLGHQVDFPAAQTCCGQMHVNTGYQRAALPLVERFVDVFADHDAVVAPSGSCVGSVRHQHAMLAERFGSATLLHERESLNARYRRAVKARGHFPTELAAVKCLYLVTRSLEPTGRGRARWTMRWRQRSTRSRSPSPTAGRQQKSTK